MIKNRFFWSWDHSTNWCLNTPGAQTCGVSNPYAKDPDMFELDYKRAIDWCAEHKMTAHGIVGMLRDRHGGVDAARRVCAYARERGTLVYIIAGLFAYGGIYYEGDHKYSLERFFEKNPEAIAVRKNGDKFAVKFYGKNGTKIDYQGCASNELLHEFVLESLDWLFREIPELGGIQMESSDTGVCCCPRCKARRGGDLHSEEISLADMAAIYPDAAETIRRASPDALIICETYHHFLDDEAKLFASENPDTNLKKLLAMPESTFWQWKCDKVLIEDTWKPEDRMIDNMKKFHHIVRSHTGTQWWGGRYTLGIDLIRRQCKLTHDAGLDSVSMFGEISPFHTNSEFNYLALEYFADHPDNSLENYVADVMAPMLGGVDEAQTYGEYAKLYYTPEKIPKAVADIAKIAASKTDYDIIRRWQYLSNFLNTYYYDIRLGGELKRMMRENITARPDHVF